MGSRDTMLASHELLQHDPQSVLLVWERQHSSSGQLLRSSLCWSASNVPVANACTCLVYSLKTPSSLCSGLATAPTELCLHCVCTKVANYATTYACPHFATAMLWFPDMHSHVASEPPLSCCMACNPIAGHWCLHIKLCLGSLRYAM